jgi:hypothetical protein
MPRTRVLRDAIIQISLVWFYPPAFVHGHWQQEEEQENDHASQSFRRRSITPIFIFEVRASRCDNSRISLS